MNAAKMLVLGMMGGRGASDPYPGLSVYDKFTDTNGVLLPAHIPTKCPVGSAWETHGVYDIQSNQANVVSLGSGPSIAVAAIDSGKANCTISAILKLTTGGTIGIVARYLNIFNYIVVAYAGAQCLIVKWEGGSASVLQSLAIPIMVAGVDYAVEVVLSGDTISATLDGIYPISVSSSFGASRTKHGVYLDKANCIMDEFQVTT